jgi:hypothetical protein
MLEDLGEALYHYTEAWKAADLILPCRRLMLNLFSNMRDPRESSDWPVSAHGDAGDDADDLFRQTHHALNDAKAFFKVLSLTRDDTEGELEDDLTDFLRCGYAHPRLWEHYAGNHAGVCLRLNREKLLDTATRDLAPKGRFTHGEIVYRNARGVDRRMLHADLDRVRTLGVERWAVERLWRFHDEFFFRKLGDWATEMEYRLLLQADHREPEFLDISDSLEAVICGSLTTDEDVAKIRDLCEARGVGVSRVLWIQALPHVVAASSGSAGAVHIDAIAGLPDPDEIASPPAGPPI